MTRFEIIVYICACFYFNFFKAEENVLNKETLDDYKVLRQSFLQNFKPSDETFETEIFGNPEVNLENGSIIGVTYQQSHAFYSIPYAQAPTGKLRFKPPVKVDPIETLNASSPNYVSCYEFPSKSSSPNRNYSEDCLVLNINVPLSIDLITSPSERLPVMFWIHGGAFFAEAGTSSRYDARYLSNVTNTIIVTVNYRLGPFGFLVYDDEEDSFDGNQGFKDQQLALEWVRDNIEYFGGDKEMVTIFGSSAGAQSVNLHLMSDKSKPMFKRAIMQSNPAAFYYQEKNEAKLKAQVLLDNLDCSSMSPVECLRNTPPENITSAHLEVALSEPRNFFNVIEPYRPVIDEDIKEQPLAYFRSGKWQNDKEVIIGTTSEEAAFIYEWFKDVNERSFEILTRLVVGEEYASAVTEEYSKLADGSGDFNYNAILVQEVSDMVFVCPTRHLARSMSSTSRADANHPAVYLYVNSHPLDGPNCPNRTDFCGYAFHGSDVQFVFNNGPLNGYTYSEDDVLVTKMFNDFWGNFAYTGMPTDDLSLWPYYTEQDSSSPVTDPWSNVRIQAPRSSVESEYRKDICDFWDDLGFYVDPIQATTAPIGETTEDSGIESTTTGSSATLTINLIFLNFSLFLSTCVIKLF